MATQGQSFVVLFSITALALPMLMLVIAPIALFIAIVFTLNRLSADSELIVMNAAGLSRWRVMRPLLALTLVVGAFSAAVSAEVGPMTLRILREQIAKVNADIVANVAVPGRFTTLEQGLTFHIRERGANGTLVGLFVYDARNPDNEATYIAERGRITQSEQGMYLILDQGILQRAQGPGKTPNFVEFQRYAFDMSQFNNAATVQYRATDRPLLDLLSPNPEDPVYKAEPARFRAELHKRLASPLYPIAAFFIAFGLLGDARTTRQGRGLAIATATAIFAAVEIAGFGSSGLVARGPAFTPIAYAIPLAGIAVGMLWIAGFVRLRIPSFIQKLADAVTARFERLQAA